MKAITAQPRSFHSTPAWLGFGLLASTGILFLSQQFQWFGFNHHKGWAVLIAVAGVGAVFAVGPLWIAAALIFRVRSQFTIRSLLLLTVAVALPFSWLAAGMKRAREQEAAVEQIKKIPDVCGVVYDWEVLSQLAGAVPSGPPAPKWLQCLFGASFFSEPVSAYGGSRDVTDAWLGYLEALTQLRELTLNETEITDAGLEHLKALTQLQHLVVLNNKITDAGLEHLKSLKHLESLDLYNTQVTDAGLKHLEGLEQLQSLSLGKTQVMGGGLEHLKSLKHLESLDLYNTQVTDAGLKHLEGLEQLQSLSLGKTQVMGGGLEHLKGLKLLQQLWLSESNVTDAGLTHVSTLTQLKELYLDRTKVTDAGLKHLSDLTQLQGLSLEGTKVTDTGLDELKGLRQLGWLSLHNTQVTDAGVMKLQQALPKCKIGRLPAIMVQRSRGPEKGTPITVGPVKALIS